MPCYYPKIRAEDTWKWIKANDGHMYHPARVFTPDDRGELERIKNNARYKYDIIPCGRCIGCELEYSRQWANRGYLEKKLWKQNWFCTITYDEEHIVIPEFVEDEEGFVYTDLDETWTGTVIDKDLQQFIKNVRQIMKRDNDQDGIRFMACGEYGENSERPHYHIIFFNLNLPVEDLFEPHIQNNEIYYRSKIIERAWGGQRYLDPPTNNYVNPKSKGISNISEATWNNIAYTARYVTKKVRGKTASQIYAAKGQYKEFLRVSRMPGIGEGYYRQHWQEIYEKDEIIIKNKNGVITSRPPRYFDELFKREHPEEWDKIKKRRKKMGEDGNILKDLQTSMFRSERLRIEARSKEEKNLQMIRVFESAK